MEFQGIINCNNLVNETFSIICIKQKHHIMSEEGPCFH